MSSFHAGLPGSASLLGGMSRLRGRLGLLTELPSSPARLPGSLPLLGDVLRLQHRLDLLTTLPAYGDLVELRIGPVGLTVACTPELSREILYDDAVFDKGGPFDARAREVLGPSLTTSTHAEHPRQRRLVQPAFHKTKMPVYADTMTQEIAELCGGWRSGDVVDVAAAAKTLVATILAKTVVAQDFTPAELAANIDDIDTLVAVGAQRILLPSWANALPTPPNRRYHAAKNRLRAMMSKAAVADGEDGNDLLSILLAARAGGDSLSQAEVVNQLMLFEVAGIDTAATALAWTLWLVATHAGVEQALHAEVDAVVGNGRPARHEDLAQLPYTRSVVSEALRLYPPVWFITRTAMRRHRLGPFTVPAGSTVAVSPYLLHHRPDVFPEPYRFDPGRWDANRNPAPPAGAYIPFGIGRRKCIGEHFAWQETTLALATIAAQWSMRPAPDLARTRPTPRLALSLRPPRLPMVLTRRPR